MRLLATTGISTLFLLTVGIVLPRSASADSYGLSYYHQVLAQAHGVNGLEEEDISPGYFSLRTVVDLPLLSYSDGYTASTSLSASSFSGSISGTQLHAYSSTVAGGGQPEWDRAGVQRW